MSFNSETSDTAGLAVKLLEYEHKYKDNSYLLFPRYFSRTKKKNKDGRVEINGRLRAKTWFALKKKILKRDNYQCQDCGSKYNLIVHHILPITVGGDNRETNLITLCKDCHWKSHTGAYSLVAMRKWNANKLAKMPHNAF